MDRILSILALVMLVGCTIMFPWNPVVNGVEFDREVSFKSDSVGVHVTRFGVWNHSVVALLEISIQNFAQDTMIISADEFVLVLPGDTIPARKSEVRTATLAPNETVDFSLWYEYGLFKHKRSDGLMEYLPSDFQIDLAPIEYTIGDRPYRMPQIGFRPRQRGIGNQEQPFLD